MAIRAKAGKAAHSTRSSTRRRSPVVVAHPGRNGRAVARSGRAAGERARKTAPFPTGKRAPGASRDNGGGNGHAHPHGHPTQPTNGYANALRYLDTLTDYERLRIVRYNRPHFDVA